MSNLTGRIFARTLIIVFYLGVMAACFYSPYMYESIKRFFANGKPEITIYTPREVFSLEKFKEFEKKTGIHVRVTYFNTNEEMLAKFKISRGIGYDIVVPSDFMVELLRKEKLLQKLDHKKISNYPKLDKRLLNKFYDPGDQYSLPVAWIPYGIGYNKKYFDFDDNASWGMIFERSHLMQLHLSQAYMAHKKGCLDLPRISMPRISMLNDARESLFLGAIYLFGRVDGLTTEQWMQVKDLLVRQKSIIETYTEAGAKQLLLSDIVQLAVMPAARIKEVDDPENFGFVIPKEGSLLDIMALGILATSKKADMAHKLIDFLLSKEVGAYNFNEVACNPSNQEAYPLVDKKYRENKAFFPDDEMFKRLFILNNEISPALLEKIWFLVKSV